MPSLCAVIVSSCEPCASARSKSRGRAHARSAFSRPRICRAFPAADLPPWWPMTVAVIPCDSISCSVWAYSRAVISTSWPCACRRCTSGRNTSGCALAVKSTQTLIRRRSGDDARQRDVARDALDVVLVPERERQQSPQLAREILAAGDVIVEHARDRFGAEEALTPERVARQGLARERLEVAAQPRGCGNGEAALASVHDLPREQRL